MPESSIYTERLLSGHHIRLIHILPSSNPDKTLECDLVVADTERLPPYEALSYFWGVDPPTVPIICNGIPINIRPNLSHAFKRVRLEQIPRVFWADALCINQDDNEEKNCQVPLMSKIYSRADKVCIWLGHNDEELISEVLRCVALTAKTCRKTAKKHGIDMRRGSNLKNVEAIIDTNAKLTPVMEAGLGNLYSSPWFSRVWCIQEVILAKDALVLWGEQELPWDDVGLTASYLFENVGRNTVKRSGRSGRYKRLKVVRYAAIMYRSVFFRHHFLWTLHAFRVFESTDPRDKVYGALGIIDSGSFEPDYGKSDGQVFADIATYIACEGGNFEILRHVSHTETYDGDEGHASWAPRWNIRHSNQRNLSTIFNLDACDRRSFRLAGERGPTQRQLCCTGVNHDGVTAVDDFVRCDMPTMIREDHPCLRTHKKVLQSGKSILGLARTMTAGNTHLKHHIAEEDDEAQNMYYKGFHEFVSWLQNPVEGIDYSRALLEYRQAVSNYAKNRIIFWTSGGSYGIGPACMRVGDIVAVLYGGDTPYVLRPRGDGYLFLGQAYVDEIMHGELVKEMEQGRRQEQVFCLI